MNQLQQKNTFPTDQESIDALDYLREALGNSGQLPSPFSSLQKSRSLKIQGEIRDRAINHRYTDQYEVPSLKLCGQWLEKVGFKCFHKVRVIPLDQLLIIWPEEPQGYGKERKML